MNGGVCKIKMRANAFAPTRATVGSAGYDVQTPVDFVLKARDHCFIDLGLALEMSPDVYARIESRSGLARRHQIVVGAGIVDNDYRGNIGVLLFNHGKRSRQFKRGDKIAQIVFSSYCSPFLVKSETLASTERDDGGFGSTGD
ncbi:dUTPase [Lambdina fiscellaria nucleopolyhedrovirus]|uniref:dUTP diphosphatase n=1 Tax=Lambdina fiscellaria nucleopolyhedrovirus TaxID=1642929 RepID=A0A0E3URA6_9ABAC|nr:dUTPase [Lambdina fiscellaria nucleopolyhedrovirus]AKC91670.1 dUTPase [Lambdina fiscellaria nucleopolyhedrovirus]